MSSNRNLPDFGNVDFRIDIPFHGINLLRYLRTDLYAQMNASVELLTLIDGVRAHAHSLIIIMSDYKSPSRYVN